MRIIARVFGLTCGFAVVAIAARFGWQSCDNEADAAAWAFIYGSVTMGGLFGHTLAIHIFRCHRFMGTLCFVASAAALVISLSNSLGAMATRGDHQAAARTQIAQTASDLRRALDRAESERKAMTRPAANEDAIEAARGRATAAAASALAECANGRGARCARREAERDQADAAAADRAKALDIEIHALKDRLAQTGPVLETNPQGHALANLFGVPESEAERITSRQNFAMALVIELLVALALVAAEILDPARPVRPRGKPNAPGTGKRTNVVSLAKERADREVMALLASGKTQREVASELRTSERTVRRIAASHRGQTGQKATN